MAMGNASAKRAAVLRATTVEAGQHCDGCDGSSTDCRAKLGPCCPDCTCAPPPGPPPHRRCSGACSSINERYPCAYCPCAACRRWYPTDPGEAELEQWRVELLATERIYVVEATSCGHRWLETTSPAYRRSHDHCKVCGHRGRGGVIMAGFATPLPSDRFVYDRDDGLGPMF